MNYELPVYNGGLRELHLFAGCGGGILGGILLGHTCVCAVELNAYRRQVLLQRQRDGILPRFPIWDDVRTFNGRPWKGIADIVCAGFPCPRFSTIGNVHGSRHFNGWPDTARIIEQVVPSYAWLENVKPIVKRYLPEIIRDLDALGYDARWGCFSCQDASATAPQKGERFFLLATARRVRLETKKSRLAICQETWEPTLPSTAVSTTWPSWIPEPTIPNLVDGLAGYVGEVSAVGDGQVPSMVRLAWETLIGATSFE